MRFFFKITPYLIALFLLLSLACLLGAGRVDFSTQICLLAAAGLEIYRLLYRFIRTKWVRVCCRVIIAGFLVFVLGLAAMQGLILHTQFTAAEKDPAELHFVTPPGAHTPPTLIVFGAALRGDVPTQVLNCRLEAALDWLNTYPDGIAILSGGMGPGETVTEASCMADWLISRGIDPSRLIMEDRSSSTAENVAFSLALADPHSSVTVVSNGFHLYRINTLLEQEGVHACLLSARMPNPGLVVSMAIRESFAVGKLLLLG